MIDSIRIKGLFNHKDSVVPLSKNLTVVTGLNDSGKSSILHAFRWLLTNKPKGGKFLLNTADISVEKGEVSIVNDGISISKFRTLAGRTSFDLEGEQFHKSDIPEEVMDCLEMKPSYSFGDTELELNFAFQLDAPFLISESPSVGALVLGKLAGTTPVDQAAKEFEVFAYRDRQELKSTKENKIVQEEKLKQFEGLDDKLQEVNILLEKVKTVKVLQNKLTELKNIRIKYNTAYIGVSRAKEICAKYASIHIISDKFKRLLSEHVLFNILIECEIAHIKVEEDYNYHVVKYNTCVDVITKLLPLTTELKSIRSDIVNCKKLLNDFETVKKNKTVVTAHLTKINTLLEHVDLTELNLKVNACSKLSCLIEDFNSVQNKYTIIQDKLNDLSAINKVKEDLTKLVTSDKLLTILSDIRFENVQVGKLLVSAKLVCSQCAREHEISIEKQTEFYSKFDICPFCKQRRSK